MGEGEGGLIKFPPLKRWGGLLERGGLLEGGLNRGFTVFRHEWWFTGKYATRKIHTKLYPGLEWRIFHILTQVKISMISLISSLSLKLHVNSLVYDRNITGTSLKVFGRLRKFSKNVRERSSGLRNNFWKSSAIFGKWSEIFGKSSITPSSESLYNKKNDHTCNILYEFHISHPSPGDSLLHNFK